MATTKLIGAYLDKSQAESLQQICNVNNMGTSDVLRTLITLFLKDYDFQHMILREVSKNEH